MKTFDEIVAVISRCSYPGVTFIVDHQHFSAGPYLQIQGTVLDVCEDRMGEPVVMHGRKWTLSRHMTDSELVQTAFLAVRTWLEHEARESFLYKGRAIFGPHFSADKLWELADGSNLDPRLSEP